MCFGGLGVKARKDREMSSQLLASLLFWLLQESEISCGLFTAKEGQKQDTALAGIPL
jgi:hypothetical protein